MSEEPKLSEVMDSFSLDMQKMVSEAKNLYQRHFSPAKAWITVAPGRVNLIGEHTDYTGGYVFPFAIDYSTVVYGTGSLKQGTETSKICFVSTKTPDAVEEHSMDVHMHPLGADDPKIRSWIWYVLGVVAQYLPDLPNNTAFEISLAISGNVPLGSGLSSSASLEVSVARFLECILGKKDFSPKIRALRCQEAENKWCHSPCGIMDQYVSSAASKGSLLLIDCTSHEFERVQTTNMPSLVITNSHVTHSIGAGGCQPGCKGEKGDKGDKSYPIRVKQCQEATTALQQHVRPDLNLRKATLQDVEAIQPHVPPVIYNRAKHVVTENARTLETKEALEKSDWKAVGQLMNASHESMRDDYEVSCSEIDILVNLAQSFDGVYGSRLTGGGFGGCTVTLVEPEKAQALMQHLRKEYKNKTGIECDCFETSPGPGARLLAVL